MSSPFQSINESADQSSRMASHPRCTIPQTSSTGGGGDIGRVDKNVYPQQHSLSTATTTVNNRNRIKPVLRKRCEYAVSTDPTRANSGGMHVPSWRKDGFKKREQLLKEDEENEGNNFVIDRQSNLRNYYAIAERVLDQFQITCASSGKLEETYLMGNRLIKFLSDVLPKHRHYHNRDPSLAELRIKSQNDLVQVRNRVDDVALLLDKETYRQVMEMEGMEEDFFPLPDLRRRNRKRVTFNLEQPSSPVADPRNRSEKQEQPSQTQGYENNNNSNNRFVQKDDEPPKPSSDYFKGQDSIITNVSSTDAIGETGNNDSLSDAWANDTWESFGSDSGTEWNLQWPETRPTDAFVVSSQQLLSFDGDQITQQQRRGPAHLCNDGNDGDDGNKCGGNDDGNDTSTNDGDCASSCQSERMTNDNRLQQLNNVMLQREVDSGPDDMDSWNQGIKTNKGKTMGNDGGVLSYNMSTSLPSFPNDDLNEKVDNNFENDGLEMKTPMSTKVFSRITDAKLVKVGSLENETYEMKTASLFTQVVSTDEDEKGVTHITNNNNVKEEGDYIHNEHSFDDESDEEFEHQEYIKRMRELEFSDETIATAETEAMTADTDDSHFNENQLPSKLAYLEYKVQGLQQVNRGPTNTCGGSNNASDSLATDGATIASHCTRGNISVSEGSRKSFSPPTLQAYLKSQGQSSCDVSSDIPSRSQNDPAVNTFGVNRNHSTPSTPQESYTSKGQSTCRSRIAASEISSRSQNDLAENDSTVKYPLQCINESKNSADHLSSTPQVLPKLQGKLQNDLMVSASGGKCRLKYPLRRRGRNVSVSESSQNHSSPITMQTSTMQGCQTMLQKSLAVNNRSKVGYLLRRKERNISDSESTPNPKKSSPPLKSLDQQPPMHNTTLRETAYSSQNDQAVTQNDQKITQNDQAVGTLESKWVEKCDSETNSHIQVRRTKAARLKSLKQTASWKRRYNNSTSNCK